MNAQRSGSCQEANCAARNSRSSAAPAVCPSRTTTLASGRSPQRSSGTPTTHASSTAGCAISAFSSSTELIHSPPDLITSLARSVRIRYPSGESMPTSPVRSQPSWNLSGSADSSPRYRSVIHGPRTTTSPTDSPSAGSDSPSGPTIRVATAAGMRPWLYRYRHISSPSAPAGGRATEPSGDISVIPQACTTWMPYRSAKACISAGGHADPPTMTSFSEETSVGWLSRYASRSVQIVGTAAASVGFSAPIIAAIGAACRNRSGMTSDAPDMNPAYGSPHDIAWNIGTMTSSRTVGPRPKPSTMQICMECSQIERCEYATPFGLPVVPDV